VFDGTIEQYAKRPFSHVIDLIVIRALKFQEIRKHIAQILISNGRVVLYRTEPISSNEIEEWFHLVNETDFILPQRYGTRVISVIERNSW
jgi:hypothetical protein